MRPQPSATHFRMDCSRHQYTRALPNSAAGKSPTFFYQATKKTSTNGASNNRSNGQRQEGRIWWS